MECCNYCKFLLKTEDQLLICRRYPKAINKSGHDWCGEWIGRFLTSDVSADRKQPDTPAQAVTVAALSVEQQIELDNLKQQNAALKAKRKKL